MASDDLTARLRDSAPTHEALCMSPEIHREAADRIEALEAWKDSAASVLAEWDETWRAAGEPGPLGQSKAENVRRRIEALEAERDGLAQALECQTGVLEDAREALSGCADRLDEDTYSELAAPLDDGATDEYGDRYRSERDAAQAEVRTLREAANRVNRAWLRGDIDAPDGEGPAALLALHRVADTEEAKSDV